MATNKREVTDLHRALVTVVYSELYRDGYKTHAQQAERLGIPLPSYGKMMRGKMAIDVQQIEDMATAIGWDVGRLFTEARKDLATRRERSV